MSLVRDFTYSSADTIHPIYAREWSPEDAPRAVVQIVHGVAEHMGRYDATARFLADHGFLVCGEDHLGHGLTADESDRKFGYFAPHGGWELLVKDIHTLRTLEGEQHPDIPYIMLGHSMGSFLTRTYLIDYPGDVSAAVLSGTGQERAPLVASGKALASALCRLKGPDYVSPLVYSLAMGSYNKPFSPARTPQDWLSRDESTVDAFLADPLCSFQPTISMFRDMLGGIQKIGKRENVAKMDKSMPILFFSGDHDPVGSMGEGVQRVFYLFRAVGCTNVSLTLYPGGRHEMLNEINREEVREDLLDWLENEVLSCP